MRRIPLLLLTSSALVLHGAGGCGLTWRDIRLPTRPDSVFGTGDSPSTDSASSVDAFDATGSDCVATGAAADVNRSRMADLVSAYRRMNGLDGLGYSRTLEAAADAFALRMYGEGFFDHTAPDGSTPGDRAAAAGFCDEYVGENIAYGLNLMRTADEAMQGFKDSPDHNENMLRAQWDFIGVGYLRVPGNRGDEYWWVQLFGTERSAN